MRVFSLVAALTSAAAYVTTTNATSLRGPTRSLQFCDGYDVITCVIHPGCSPAWSPGFRCIPSNPAPTGGTGPAPGGPGGFPAPSGPGGPGGFPAPAPTGGGGLFPCDTIHSQPECDMHASNHCHWHDGVNRCQNN
jgi:hypothetical protein